MSTDEIVHFIKIKREQVANLWDTGKHEEACKISVELDELIILAMKHNIEESEVDLRLPVN